MQKCADKEKSCNNLKRQHHFEKDYNIYILKYLAYTFQGNHADQTRFSVTG